MTWYLPFTLACSLALTGCALGTADSHTWTHAESGVAVTLPAEWAALENGDAIHASALGYWSSPETAPSVTCQVVPGSVITWSDPQQILDEAPDMAQEQGWVYRGGEVANAGGREWAVMRNGFASSDGEDTTGIQAWTRFGDDETLILTYTARQDVADDYRDALDEAMASAVRSTSRPEPAWPDSLSPKDFSDWYVSATETSLSIKAIAVIVVVVLGLLTSAVRLLTKAGSSENHEEETQAPRSPEASSSTETADDGPERE